MVTTRFIEKRCTTIALLCMITLFVAANAFAQVVTVTGATGTAGPYTTLKAAFDAINATAQTGNTITITIAGTTAETAPAVLNAGAWTSITINPTGGAAATVAGAIAAGSPLIDFVGADNVTINGLNTGGNSLTLSNTTVSATSNTGTIRFTTDATNNTITNCSILGSATMALGTGGGNIFFGSAAVTTGNDNNTISNNNIGPAGANIPTKLITFTGSSNTDPGTANSGIVINNNNFFDWFSATAANAAIDVNSGTVNLSITNNRFYQTATRTITTTTSVVHSGVRISNSSGFGYSITGNIFGYASNTQTGNTTIVFPASTSDAVVPIILTSVSTTASPLPASVQNNTIAGFAMSGGASGTSSSAVFRGIYVAGGVVNIGDVTGNTIGSMSATGSITFTSSSASAADIIGMFNFGSSNWTTNNNTVGGITVSNSSTGAANLYGLRCFTASTVTWTVLNNTIGGTVANSMQSTSTATGTIVQGILNSSPIGTFTGNTIRNLTAAGGTGTTTAASVAGIVITATSNQTIGQNTIFNLSNSNATAATTVTGIQFNGSTANVVERNLIHSLTSATTSTTAEVNGIRVAGGTTIYRNNMIAIGAGIVNAIGSAATNSGTSGVNGINEFLGTNSFFHNSVYIGGGPTAGVGASYAFNGTQTVNTRSFRDNIFFNARTNSGATGKHYAVKINGTVPNPTGLTINNNVYFANGTGAVFGFFNSLDVANLAAWKTAVGQDAGSFESNPQYNDPTNAVPDLHIHPTNATVAEGNGADVGVTNDYDGQTRASFTPVDIGADAGNFTGVDLTGPIISYTNLANTTSTANRSFTAVTITDNSGVNGTAGTRPRVYYKKSTQANTFNDNTNATDGWKFAEANGSATPFDFTIDYSLLLSGGVAVSDIIQYFVVAQDLATTPNVSINSGVFTAQPSSVALTSGAFPITGTINSYSILGAISGSFTVGTSASPLAAYPTITAAVADLNTKVMTGAVTFVLIDPLYDATTSETFPITINANAGASASNTLIIKPNTAVTPAITGSSASGVFVLNGADYVTIDGSNSGGTSRDMTITNTNTGTSSAVVWGQTATADGATNNTIKNVNLVGNSNTTTLFGVGSGSSTISTTSTGTGNNSNTFQNNNISKCQYGIFSGGASAANKNTGTTISQNIMTTASPNNLGKGGIIVRFEDGIAISQNEIDNISINLSGDVVGIDVGIGVANYSTTVATGSDVTNATISRNKIGKIENTNTTGFSAVGIGVAGVTSGTNTIVNNFVAGVISPVTSPDVVAGILIGGATGSTTNVYYNSVSMTGTLAGASLISSIGVAITGTNPTVNFRNNILYNTQVMSTTGKSYSIATTSTTFTNLTSDYNDLFTSGTTSFFAATGGLTAGTDRTSLSAWQTATGKDAFSNSGDPGFTSATNLHIDAANVNGWNVNGRGISITGQSTDIDGDARSIATGVPTDIGADEYAPNNGVNPADAVESAAPVVSTTTSYTSGGRKIAEITWGAGGTPPSSIAMKYFSGSQPPFLGGTTFKSYWNATATGGSGYSYNMTLYYTAAEVGAIPSFLNYQMSKSTTGFVWEDRATAVDNPNNRVSTLDNPTSFSNFSVRDNALPLPIVLASFTAREIRGQGVRLDWRTLSEINNYGFYVQRKLQSATEWVDVNSQIIPGNGTTNEPHDYTFTDRTVTTGSWQYRLRQVDLDGTEHFTEPINVTTVTSVKEVAPIEFALKQNYPNPFNPETSIKFSVEQTGRATLEIYNMLGQKVATLFDDVVEAGYYQTVKFSGSSLASGIYLYRLQSGQKSDLKKLMLVK